MGSMESGLETKGHESSDIRNWAYFSRVSRIHISSQTEHLAEMCDFAECEVIRICDLGGEFGGGFEPWEGESTGIVASFN